MGPTGCEAIHKDTATKATKDQQLIIPNCLFRASSRSVSTQILLENCELTMSFSGRVSPRLMQSDIFLCTWWPRKEAVPSAEFHRTPRTRRVGADGTDPKLAFRPSPQYGPDASADVGNGWPWRLLCCGILGVGTGLYPLEGAPQPSREMIPQGASDPRTQGSRSPPPDRHVR